MSDEVKLLPCEDRDFLERLKTDPQNVANQLLALTRVSDWARVAHRGNFDSYLIAAAELLAQWNTRAIEATRPTDMEVRDVKE